MKVIMYGAEICPDCVDAKEQLTNRSDIELDYRNITKNTSILKEFLSYRDHEEMFTAVKEAGKIGIPFFVVEDGRKTFDISEYVEMQKSTAIPMGNACALDGSGQC